MNSKHLKVAEVKFAAEKCFDGIRNREKGYDFAFDNNTQICAGGEEGMYVQRRRIWFLIFPQTTI